MKKSNFANWKKHGFEYFSIFIAVLSAFVLNNWNENRRDSNSESKILIEIANGLEKDIVDTKLNIKGHKAGISASNYFIQVINNKKVNTDSIMMH